MTQINLIGKTVLGYTVSEKLGAGAFGTVYKVIKNNASGQYVRALKHITIPTEKQYNSVLNSMGGDVSKTDNYFSKMLNSIVSEIKILNELSEKGVQHIVRYYENDIIVSNEPRRYDVFILMEYLTPLENYIEENEFLVCDVIQLAKDVLEGLQSCHSNGIIHRDIKDDNIFVSEAGEYKVGDFGVSKVLKDSSKAESLKGTPNFLAPEVYLGKESYTKSVDLYSLGIVMYRLLNYSRNPFLPNFPEQYFSQDEDDAFEKRMNGNIPSKPLLGGEYIGNVIVQSIARSEERFQSADEFLKALKDAEKNTSSEILNAKIKFDVVSQVDRKEKIFTPTIGQSESCMILNGAEGKDEKNSSINRHLFESVGEDQITDIPKIELITPEKKRTDSEIPANNFSANFSEKVVKFVPHIMDETKEISGLDRTFLDKFAFVLPGIVCLIGLSAYFIVIPKIYGQMDSLFKWIFTSPQNIVTMLYNPEIILPQAKNIMGIRIFWWIWMWALIASLFYLGKHLQKKPEPNSTNAILIKKEPYFMIMEVAEILEQTRLRQNNKNIESLICSVKKLEEKLSIESDFGYGEHAVIACENNIAKQIQFLLETAPLIEDGKMDETVAVMNVAIKNINAQLKKRTELKKR